MIDYSRFQSLKGEFEAEGLTREELAVEVLYAARRGLDYLVKIGGCEAKSDVDYLRRLGVTSVVAPMIESGFAMEKYMGMLPEDHFRHVGVTVETDNAVERIEELLDAGTRLDNVTIGRSDLTASFKGAGVDSAETIGRVKTVARAAKRRDLDVTMGGGVNAGTVRLLREDRELAELLDHVETRKVIMAVADVVEQGALEAALAVELELLDLRAVPAREVVAKASRRADQIRARA